MIDYEILRLIWWAVLGVILIGFAIMDGFDLGAAILLPIIGKNDDERRIIINTIAPVWEGNQVWLILGGGAIFAAWPLIYAASFSGLYFAMFLALFAIIIRPVGFKFRSKFATQRWRTTWDLLLCLGGIIASFVFGVAFGNLFIGFPFHFEETTLRIFYTGSFWGLLTPLPILCGVASIMMAIMQGANFLAIKTTQEVQKRAKKFSQIASMTLLSLFVILTWYSATQLMGVNLTTPQDHSGPSNPLLKSVSIAPNAWGGNFVHTPALLLIPMLAVVALIMTFLLSRTKLLMASFISSSLAVFCIITTCGVMLFPFMMISSTHPSHSLTVWDASSSQLTLFVMLIATVIFLPIVLIYTGWVYRVLRGPVDKKSLDDEINAY